MFIWSSIHPLSSLNYSDLSYLDAALFEASLRAILYYSANLASFSIAKILFLSNWSLYYLSVISSCMTLFF